MVKKYLSVLLSIFLVAACAYHKPSNPIESAPIVDPPSQVDPIENQPFALEHRTEKIAIKFNPKYLPLQTSFLEILYDGQYQGYFSIYDTIFLPREQGEHQLKVFLSDSDGSRFGEVRTYTLNVR